MNENMSEKLKLVLERVDNIMGKGENASCQCFLLFQHCFQKANLFGTLKIVHYLVKG